MSMISGFLLVSSLAISVQATQPIQDDGPFAVQVITLGQGSQETLTLRIRNVSPSAALVCVRTPHYRFDGKGGGRSTPYDCRAEKSFSVVLPGESYFYRVQESSDLEGDSEVAIGATVVFRQPMAAEAGDDRDIRLEWKGTMRQARDDARRLLTERSPDPNRPRE